MVELESAARLRTDPSDAADWPLPQYRHLRLGNAHDVPGRTAELIVEQLGLPQPSTG
ncbi:hypothetical protein [Humibacillus sp. DSM 29435]|uniref:hypothetical protein n=1 Tax=Humibacillus sp. DSM 29435 TaxID=1869167 RepID=UPI0015864239|nr:hypothetical protein [Humibacillus sp. DSM 29435]